VAILMKGALICTKRQVITRVIELENTSRAKPKKVRGQARAHSRAHEMGPVKQTTTRL